MAKIRTEAHLQAALDNEFGWRLRELASLRSAAVNSTDLRQRALIRGAIPIAYAHWEGFVKKSSSYYGVYLSSIGLQYKDLKSCFSGLGVMVFVQNLGEIKRRFTTAASTVSYIQRFGNENVTIKLWPVIEDIGNLSFDLFVEIAEFLGIDSIPYATKKNFIDESLVSSRNKIAHGERLEVDLPSMLDTFDEVIGLLRHYKNDIENNASSKAYLAV